MTVASLAGRIRSSYDPSPIRPDSWVSRGIENVQTRSNFLLVEDAPALLHQIDAASLRRSIIAAMETSKFDFRTALTISNEIGASERKVQSELDQMVREGSVRPPIRQRRSESGMYRLVKLGYTRGEKWRLLQGIISRSW